MIKIRESKIKDEGGIAEVNQSAITTLRKIYRPNKKALHNKFKLLSCLNQLVATMNHIIVGAVEYEIKNNTIFIVGLDVLEKYRKKGVAKKMIEFLSIKANKNSIHYLTLHTIKETGNVSIFKKLGFKVISETIDLFSESDQFKELTDVKMQLFIKK